MEESLEQLSSVKKTCLQIFNEQFPFYLSIGMTASEYWDGDPMLARGYAKAYVLKRRRDNFDAWLQGMYNYEALSVVLGNILRRKGDKPNEYSKRPYFLDQKEQEEYEQQKAVERANRLFGYMNRKLKIQKQIKEQEGETNVED